MLIALTFPWAKSRNYSLSALIGSIEIDSELTDIEIIIVNGSLKTSIERISKKFDKIIICISFMTPDLKHIRNEIDSLSSLQNPIRKKLILIAGGPHPTGDPLGTLKMGFDIIVIGEGEKTLRKIISKIKNNDSIEDLKGLAYQKNHQTFIKKSNDWINLDDFPAFAPLHRLFSPIEISRGCPFVCNFCQTPRIHGGSMRHRSISNICRHLRYASKIGKKNTWFISSNAFAYGSFDGKKTNETAIEDLLRSIRKIPSMEKIFFGTFPSEVRPEFVTDDLVSLIIEYCTNRTLSIGAQSGSDRILEFIHREHTVEEIMNSIEIVKKYGIIPYVDIIFGLPSENDEDRARTRELMKFVIDKGGIIHSHVFIPLPGTPFQRFPPGRITIEDRNYIQKLTATGKANGSWQHQMRIGEEIDSVFQKKRALRRKSSDDSNIFRLM
ncbi:B12-binding domain/radical SAM domain-containing protein [Candidatus Bathyarchaeota archaeon RBG_13_38_9]|nr:MAG: B12-binding domain/radical SAM domain-containing protein [Candidatus Bathyarchaeota archaeon RBG_13_38_9]